MKNRVLAILLGIAFSVFVISTALRLTHSSPRQVLTQRVDGEYPIMMLQTTPAAASTSISVIPSTGSQTYTVVPGDTIGAIAARYKTTIQAILANNPWIKNPNLLYPGNVITIPSAGGPGVPNTGGQTYTVVAGDTLEIIAARFNTSVQAILDSNPWINNSHSLSPGEVISIPPEGSLNDSPLVIQYELPKKWEVGRSDYIVVSIVPYGPQDNKIPIPQTGHELELATPFPPTFFALLQSEASDKGDNLYAAAKLVSTAFAIAPVTEEQQSIAQPKLIWEWNMTPQAAGQQVINVNINGLWVSKTTKDTHGQEPIWLGGIPVSVAKPFITVGQLDLVSWASGTLTTGLSIPWIYERVKGRKKRRAKKGRPPGLARPS